MSDNLQNLYEELETYRERSINQGTSFIRISNDDMGIYLNWISEALVDPDEDSPNFPNQDIEEIQVQGITFEVIGSLRGKVAVSPKDDAPTQEAIDDLTEMGFAVKVIHD